MVVTHTHANPQGQMLVSSNYGVETDGWMDGGNCITSRANAIYNKNKYIS